MKYLDGERMDKSHTNYNSLCQDDNDESQTRSKTPHQRSWLSYLGVGCLVLVAVLLGIAIGFSSQTYRIQRPPPPQITDCGHTSREAILRGCVLEPMVYGWMPPQCQYPSITAKHDPWSKWQWYADENMTQPVTRGQLERGEALDLWNNRGGYHLEHCLFLYEKLMYAVENKMPWIDRKTLAAHHAYHCVDQLTSGVEAWNATTWTGLAMYQCERAPWA